VCQNLNTKMSRQPKKSKAAKFEHLQGVISVHHNGYGFMQPEDSALEEIFIPPPHLGNAMPGDKVLVRLRPGRPQKGKREGAVVKILERKVTELFGFFNGGYVVPRDERIRNWFFVPPGKKKTAVAGDLVRALITVYPDASGQAQAEIIEILGKELTPKLESHIILRQYGFPEEFSSQIDSELSAIPEWVREEDAGSSGRVDLSEIPFITIDPVDAKDFDDAVAVKKIDWGFRLWVAIADVSHYVVSGSEIDFQAYRRATSVYFPDRAIPMLPEVISAGIASLKPEENRLAMVAEIDYDLSGKAQRNKFYPALIKSRFRMNYMEVQAIYDGEDPSTAFKYEPVAPMLSEMADLAKLLQQARTRRGSDRKSVV
jgi:ribonuclease R